MSDRLIAADSSSLAVAVVLKLTLRALHTRQPIVASAGIAFDTWRNKADAPLQKAQTINKEREENQSGARPIREY